MTGIRKRSPTNKEFKTNFQGLASTKTKKGHLNNEDKKASDNAVEKGTLVRIHREKIYDNGWEVKVGSGKDSVTYMCSYGDGILQIPDSNITNNYFIPKNKTEVELTIDKKSKIYTIIKLKTSDKKPIALFDDNLTISTNTNTDTNSDTETSIEVGKTTVNINSNNVTITDSDDNVIDLVENAEEQKKLGEQQEQFEKKQSKIEGKVDSLSKENMSILKRIEIIEEQINNQEENNEGD